MHRLIAFLALLSFALCAHAAREERYQSHPQINFAPQSVVWTLASDVNARQEPNPKSAVVAKLPIGTEVTVISDSAKEPQFIQNGITANWLKGRFQLRGETREGYIWSGVLTQTRIKSAADDGTYFYLGLQMVKHDADYGDSVTNQLRAANNGNEIGKIVFAAPNQVHHTVAALSEGSQGLSNVNDVLTLNFTGEYCGANNGEMLIFWTGTQFVLGETAQKFSDPPVYHLEDWILPQDKGGKKGQILWKMKEGDEENEAGKEKTASASWVWDGMRMVKK